MSSSLVISPRSYTKSRRKSGNRIGVNRLARTAGGDARGGAFPTRVDGAPRFVEVDDHGRVVGRDRLALARLAIDLRPHHAFGDRLCHQQMVDAHAVVLVKHAGPVVPPAVALAFGVQLAVRIGQSPAEEL